MAFQKFCLALDLIEDEALMADYKAHHQSVWPEVIQSIKDAGIRFVEYLLCGQSFVHDH
jgi:L-rhamnose mutarotase